MEHTEVVVSNSPGSTAPRPSEIGGVNPFCCGVTFGQKPSTGSTQNAESRGRSQVEVTVLRARNVPHIKTTFGRKREFFVTIAYGATTKTEKQTKKRTKSVHTDGQTAVWDQRLDPFFVHSSSHLILCLYAKRLTRGDVLIGTLEMAIPESENNISVALNDGNGQAGPSTPPVTLDLKISVSANGTSPSDPQTIPTERDETPAEEVPKPTIAPNPRGPDPSSASDHLLPPPDHLPVQSNTDMPQDQGETSLVDSEKARVVLVRVDEVNKSIDRSNTWEGAVEKIKWVMDILSPVAGLHPIAQMAHKVLSVIPELDTRNSQNSINATTMYRRYSRACTTRLISQTMKTL
ncbi:hypothetical protein EDB85DRAFT_66772 [Lactarius pseudohatsudake]|nr:hypothetical protein EDB85DRAFT_66772 [Lactarius pseudohatsudake]